MVVSSFLYLSSAAVFAVRIWVSKVVGEKRVGSPVSILRCSLPSAVFRISLRAIFPSAFQTVLATLLKFVR